jgi:excinuclease ABC subunit A
MANPKSVTGQYLTGEREIEVPEERRPINKKKMLRVVGATGNNLKNVTGEIPVGTFTCITGVSGGGKSTFTIETLYKAAARRLHNASDAPARTSGSRAWRTSTRSSTSTSRRSAARRARTRPPIPAPSDRSATGSPACPRARPRLRPGPLQLQRQGRPLRGLPGRRLIKIEMHFLPDVYVTCDVCKGKRYNRETLEILFKGKSIADVLDMTVEEAADFFKAVPPIRDKMETLKRVGLGYVKVGQSGDDPVGRRGPAGEAVQGAVSKRATGKTLYILDEPTTGLHFEDTKKLLEVLHELVDQGNTVVVIEHNLDVVKTADWLLDFGPEGGDGGGEIVAVGTPRGGGGQPRRAGPAATSRTCWSATRPAARRAWQAGVGAVARPSKKNAPEIALRGVRRSRSSLPVAVAGGRAAVARSVL